MRSPSDSSRRSTGMSESSATTSATASDETSVFPRRLVRAPAKSKIETALSGSARPGK